MSLEIRGTGTWIKRTSRNPLQAEWLNIKRPMGSDGSSLVQVRSIRGPRLSMGKQKSKQCSNLFTCVRDFIQYARLWKKQFLDYRGRKQPKTIIVSKDNSCSSSYILLCAFISQYSHKVDFSLERWSSNGGPKGGQSQIETRAPCLPLETPYTLCLQYITTWTAH